jgi:hypothetical protein
MKLFTGWVMSAGLVLFAAGANAQMLAPYDVGRSPYRSVSDIEGPYAAMPQDTPAPRYGYGPTLLPPSEVYMVVRESGFSPLGIPHQHGFVYTISVVDRRGDDGRLVIDARNGRIIRFMPAYRMGDNLNDDQPVTYGPVGSLPPATTVRGGPRPPRSIPHVASRTPVPKPSPLAAPSEPAQQSAVPKASPPAAQSEPVQQSAVPKAVPPPAQSEPTQQSAVPQPSPPAAQTEPVQQSAAVQTKQADAPATPQAATTGSAPAKPAAPQIAPTQQMPLVQGLE